MTASTNGNVPSGSLGILRTISYFGAFPLPARRSKTTGSSTVTPTPLLIDPCTMKREPKTNWITVTTTFAPRVACHSIQVTRESTNGDGCSMGGQRRSLWNGLLLSRGATITRRSVSGTTQLEPSKASERTRDHESGGTNVFDEKAKKAYWPCGGKLYD